MSDTAAAPVTDRRRLSDIAYGFMASKALFAALEVDLFGQLADGAPTCAELAERTGLAPHRMRTLLGALAALGLVVVERDRYTNAPASARWLVRGAPGDVGSYFRLQVARQIYPALLDLDAGLAGADALPDAPGGRSATLGAARAFTEGQHAGSLGPARRLAGRLPLHGARRLLDVGGGSGAFSIALCERNPELRASVLDRPAVLDVARSHCDDAGLGRRIDLVPADAVHDAWPPGQDVVLLSYLLSALPDADIGTVLARAHAALVAGGLLVVHDFMLDDGGPGPTLAALWFLQYLAYRPDCVSFTAGGLRERIRAAGFRPTTTESLIPGVTTVVLARKAVLR
jgi:ubiquinone/menaquinone biosynthesis C-methylase UbiE